MLHDAFVNISPFSTPLNLKRRDDERRNIHPVGISHFQVSVRQNLDLPENICEASLRILIRLQNYFQSKYK